MQIPLIKENFQIMNFGRDEKGQKESSGKNEED